MNNDMAAHLEHAKNLAEESQLRARELHNAMFQQQQHDEGLFRNDSNRGSSLTPLLTTITCLLLRAGFLLQLSALFVGFFVFYAHGGTGVFTFDLFGTAEELRHAQPYSHNMVLLETVMLAGALCLACYQTQVADDSKATRGFRAGSKLFSTAATLDIIVAAMRLMQYFYAYNFLSSRWWQKYMQSNTDWCLFHTSAYLHSIAMALYGIAIFYSESYHEEGTYEEWAWLCLGLFTASSVTGAFNTVLQLLALIAAVLWACGFEPITQKRAPAFHERDVNYGFDSN